jgi:hypothetical protein
MVDRELLAARMVAETRRQTLGLSHPRIDGNPRSTI